MIAVVVDFLIKTEHAQDFHQAVLRHSHNSLTNEPECKQFDVMLDPENAAHFLLCELYTSQEAFEFHRQQPYMQQFVATIGPWIENKMLKVWEMKTELSSAKRN
ncbi:MAG: putative quinol monooxygenase [Zavarzinella sp.]